MPKQLTRHGNSLALVIDKPILELLHIDAETPLDITTDGTMLFITPVRDAKQKKKFQAALKDANLRYSSTLKKLAE